MDAFHPFTQSYFKAQQRVAAWLRGLHEKGHAKGLAQALHALENYSKFSAKSIEDSLEIVFPHWVDFHPRENDLEIRVKLRARHSERNFYFTFPGRYVGRRGSLGGVKEWIAKLKANAESNEVSEAMRDFRVFRRLDARFRSPKPESLEARAIATVAKQEAVVGKLEQ